MFLVWSYLKRGNNVENSKKNCQAFQISKNGLWTIEICEANMRSMRFYENARISLNYEMIYIDDEHIIDEYLNDSARCNLFQVLLSNSENCEALILV